MAIRIRRGNSSGFDPNKLVAGELGLVLDTGELYFCYSAGNTKKLATTNDLQTMLDASSTSYAALLQLIDDLNDNPSELTNILNNISALQSGKIDKTSITQTTATNSATMVPSSAVTYGLQQAVNTVNDNLAKIKRVEQAGAGQTEFLIKLPIMLSREVVKTSIARNGNSYWIGMVGLSMTSGSIASAYCTAKTLIQYGYITPIIKMYSIAGDGVYIHVTAPTDYYTLAAEATLTEIVSLTRGSIPTGITPIVVSVT